MNKVSDKRTIAKNSIYLYARMAILMVLSLISVRFVFKALGVVDYGVYSAVGGLVVSFSFLSRTLVSASQRFFSIEIGLADKEKLKIVFDSIIFSYLFIVLIVLILLETIGLWFVSNRMSIPLECLNSALVLYHLSVFTFIIHILSYPFNALIIAHEDMKTYAFISLIEGGLKFLTALSLLGITGDRLIYYGSFLLIVSIIVFISYFIVCYKRYECVNFKLKFNNSQIKSIFSYSSWTIFGTLAGVANTQGINMMLNVFFGPILNAAYSIGHQISGVISQLSNSFFAAVQPSLTKSYAIESSDKTVQLFTFSTKVLLVLLNIVIIPVCVLLEDILKIWLVQVDPYMISFARLLLAYVYVLAISNPITTIVQASGGVKRYHGIVDSFVLITLPIIYFTFKQGANPNMSFVVLIIVFSFAHLIRMQILKKYLDYSTKGYFLKLIVPSLLSVLVVVGVELLLYNAIEHILIRIIIIVISSIILTIVTSFYLILSSNERVLLKNHLMQR